MGKKPKEDPSDKKARLRERRLSEIERQQSSEGNAAGLAADLRSVYGMLPSGGAPSQPFSPSQPMRIRAPGIKIRDR
jgi:hypothetical protein